MKNAKFQISNLNLIISPGFTLIELIVVISVSSLLLWQGLVRYQDFNRDQEVEQAGLNFAVELRSVQQMATAGERPSGCTGDLLGYRVEWVNEKHYNVIADCGGGPVTVKDNQKLSGRTEFSTNFSPIYFQALYGTVNNAISIFVQHQLHPVEVDRLEIIVTEGGVIENRKAPGPTSILPTVTPTTTPVPPSATVTPTPSNTPSPSPTPTPEAVMVDSTSAKSDVSTNTVFLSQSVSGNNRLLVVGVSINDSDGGISSPPQYVKSVTYSGKSLSPFSAAIQANGAYSQIWYLLNPPVGTADVIVSFNTILVRPAIVGALSLVNVNQTDPFGNFARGSNYSSVASLDIASQTAELVIGVLSASDIDFSTTGSGQTDHWKLFEEDGGLKQYGAGTSEIGSVVTTISWDLSNTGSWALSAVAVKP